MTRRVITLDDCKYGKFSVYEDDYFIGRSLAAYGEYSDYETEVFRKVLKEGSIAMELGSNIGSLTVPMAQCVGETGIVYAFEPGEDAFTLLKQNIEQNGLVDRVKLYKMAATDRHMTLPVYHNPSPNYPKVSDGRDNPHAQGEKADEYCESMTIDELNLERLDFVKIDVDGCEQSALDGMRETIKRCRPVIFIENEIPHKAEKLVATLVDAGYRGFWYTPPLYRFDNHKGVLKNIFPGLVSLMQVFVPEEQNFVVKGCDEVPDLRMDDQIFDREIARYTRYLEKRPDDLNVRTIIAHYQGLMQRLDEADKLLDENLRIDPDHIPSKAIRGFHELQRGNYKDGWQLYELRFHQKKKEQFGGHRIPDFKKWDGKPTYDPVLIWSEQGFGDTIMFGRYFQHVLERAPNAVLEVQAELYELFETSGVAPKGQLFRINRSPPEFDYKYQCSLPSCPAVLGDDGSMIPIQNSPFKGDPYLFADGRLRTKWRHVIGDRKIGVCWEGSPRSERPYTRNVKQELLRNIDIKYGPLFSLVDDGQFDSFAATAAAIMEMDLVITVDTSIAHLAGALGKPVWLMLAFDPDFRWGLEGTSTPWYPSMRIFRQNKVLDWSNVIADIETELEKRVGKIANQQAAE